MRQLTLLKYERYRYLKAATLLTALSITAYMLDSKPVSGAYGGTWLGYLFGFIASLIVVMQFWYGIRRRLTPKRAGRRGRSNYASLQRGTADRQGQKTSWIPSNSVTLQGWLSAHVYFGTSLAVLATLHSGFQFGWNIHTFTYVLMMLVIMSGFYGVYAYLHYPRLMTGNMGGDTLDMLLFKIDDLDELVLLKSLQFSDEVCAIVLKACQGTQIGGNFFQVITAYHRKCPTVKAVQQLSLLGKNLNGDQLKSFHDIFSIMVNKEALVTRARLDVMYKARLEFWLYLHTPLAIAFLAALLAHIVAIFFYW